jgi:acylpyruvate hydrolase
VRLCRALVDGRPLVLLQTGDGHRPATLAGATFADLPQLLQAAGGSAAAIEAGDAVTPDDGTRLGAVGSPSKVVCIGLNYRLHAEESGAPLPGHPMLFPKWDTSLTEPGSDIELPPESSFVDWESELVVVFGKRCRRVLAAEADQVVFGYTIANDVSMRDFQNHTGQFTAGKAWDRSTPVGPVVVPLAEAGGIEPDLAIQGRLNGELVQDSRTSDLIFSIPQLVEYLTTIMTMRPGDIVLTGTPSGVGVAAAPPRSLASGDVFEISIEGIGSLSNTFVAPSPG